MISSTLTYTMLKSIWREKAIIKLTWNFNPVYNTTHINKEKVRKYYLLVVQKKKFETRYTYSFFKINSLNFSYSLISIFLLGNQKIPFHSISIFIWFFSLKYYWKIYIYYTSILSQIFSVEVKYSIIILSTLCMFQQQWQINVHYAFITSKSSPASNKI